ncbi:MAG: DUF192 domain-containing protein [Gammaproteobacteria bacterium]
MDRGHIVDATSSETIVTAAYRTANAWERLCGLLGRAPLDVDEGLLIAPCGSIHTLFMAYPIDVVYLARDLTVLRVIPALRPWRCSIGFGAASTLELAAGGAARAGLVPGRRLRWEAARHT